MSTLVVAASVHKISVSDGLLVKSIYSKEQMDKDVDFQDC
jgi:hypothetical protein